MSNPHRRARQAQLLAIAAQLEAPDGTTDILAVRAAYEQWLLGNPHVLDAHEQAVRDVEALDRARRPQMDIRQATMFDPDGWIVTGEGQRCRMSRAKRRDCYAAMQYRTVAHVAEANDYTTEMGYWNARVARFPDDTTELETIERVHFGWHP